MTMSCVDLPAPLPLRQSVGLRVGLSRDRLRRLALPAIVLVAVVALVLAIDGPGRTFADALSRALNADPRWVVAALGFEVLSFAGYAVLLWHVAGRDVPRLDLRASAQLTLAGTAASRALPTAGAGGAALTLWALRRAGQSARDRRCFRPLRVRARRARPGPDARHPAARRRRLVGLRHRRAVVDVPGAGVAA